MRCDLEFCKLADAKRDCESNFVPCLWLREAVGEKTFFKHTRCPRGHRLNPHPVLRPQVYHTFPNQLRGQRRYTGREVMAKVFAFERYM